MKEKIAKKIATKDVQSGLYRAMLVQPYIEKRKVSMAVRKRLARGRRKRQFFAGLKNTVKVLYFVSILLAAMTAGGLIQYGRFENFTDIARIIACMVWVTTPVAGFMMKGE